ncbi:MAG: aspartate/glutamate racemase family protein [Pseudomonadota bacterium]
MAVHVHIVTPVVPTGLTSASDFEGILGPEDRITFQEIENGVPSVETELDEVLAAPETVARAIEAEASGADAVVIDCFCDPALRAARECLTIPVLGPGETSMNMACILGHRFSVLSVTKNMSARFADKARVCGAWGSYVSTRSVEVPVTELSDARSDLDAKLLKAALLALAEDGADTLVLGCTGMLGLADTLSAALANEGWEVPVIDPIPITIRLAKSLVDMRLSHSKRFLPRPTQKKISGFSHSAFEMLHKLRQD